MHFDVTVTLNMNASLFIPICQCKQQPYNKVKRHLPPCLDRYAHIDMIS